jgi:hypothetical protein
MKGDRSRLYDKADAFYELEGNVVMKLSPKAAIEVCRSAADHGLVVARIEGGLWNEPVFQARRDCIWDGAHPPLTVDTARSNNEKAAEFIDKESKAHGAFVLTAPPITGWSHKMGKKN